MPGETSGDISPPAAGRNALRSISGRKAGEDHARSQCPEIHQWTQGPLRGDENHFKIKCKTASGRKRGPLPRGSDAASQEVILGTHLPLGTSLGDRLHYLHHVNIQ